MSYDFARTRAAITQGVATGLHIGAQLAVFRDGHSVLHEATGLARPAVPEIGQSEQPMTPDTLVVWMSAGKPITAVGIAQLWEQGLLALDDPIAKHVPEFAQHGKDAITIRHALTHTAPLRLVDIRWPLESWEQGVARVCAARPEPRFIPGRHAGYSMHATWFMLGEIIRRLAPLMPARTAQAGGESDAADPFDTEDVAATTLARHYRTHLFLPAGMPDSHLALSPAQQAHYADRLAIMQVTEKHPAPPFPYGTETPNALANPRPSGGLRGPVRELARFYENVAASMSGLQSAIGNGQSAISSPHPLTSSSPHLLLPQTTEALTARHRVHTPDKTFGAIIDWGLGFILNSNTYGNPATPYQYGPHAGPRTFGHSGNQSSVAFHDPDNRVTVACVFNGMPGEQKHQARTRAVLDAIYEDLGLAQ
ncbi:MAG: serine hydrolase domain-containing protein [Phycisphaerae bacterium]|nr:serine hydrolase domain-containing protein [Tepidisphaeraceae bacterium]